MADNKLNLPDVFVPDYKGRVELLKLVRQYVEEYSTDTKSVYICLALNRLNPQYAVVSEADQDAIRSKVHNAINYSVTAESYLYRPGMELTEVYRAAKTFRLNLLDKLIKEYKWKQPMQLSKRFKELLATLKNKLSSTLKRVTKT